MIRGKLNVFILILIFLISTISSAAVISVNINQSQTNNVTNESRLTNDANQTDNSTNQTTSNQTSNQTMDNQTRDALISNLSQEVNQLDSLCNVSNETAIAEYSGQKLQDLKSTVTSSNISSSTKKKLLLNINTALQTNNQAISSLLNENEEQARSELQYEYGLLNQINAQIVSANGTAINSTTANNLTQTVNQIKTGHEKGDLWILENDPDLQVNQTAGYYSKIQNKVEEIKNTVSELEAGGVPVNIEVMDISELQQRENGTYSIKNSSSTSVNGTAKVHAIAPVIIIAGVIIVSTAVLAVIETDGQIKSLQETEGPICDDCKFNMYLKNIAAAELGTMLTAGVSLFGKEGIELAKLGLKEQFKQFTEAVSGEFIKSLFDTASAELGDGCNTPGCIFYKYKRVDLKVSLNEPDEAYYKHVTTINTIVYNTKCKNASSFKVTLYENTTPPTGGTMNFAPIETKTVSGLSGKSQIVVPFNWTPRSLGSHTLKVVVDSDNEINETVESNNEDSGVIEVKYHLMKLQLYATTSLPSSNDPNQPRSVTYYFKAEHPVLLSPSERTPTFIYNTSAPEYSPDGFQVFYPWGAMWQYYSDTQDVNGTWNPCFSNPYVICGNGTDIYTVDHWAMGSGYYQYFAVKMMVHSSDFWGDSIIKTKLNELWVLEKDG